MFGEWVLRCIVYAMDSNGFVQAIAHKIILMYYSCHTSFMNEDAIFKAIAHPARREILALLAAANRSVKELTATFTMSQPAVSQHLRELRDAKLVTSEKVGLEQRYRLTGTPLKVVFDWSSRYRRFFDPAGHAWRFADTEKPPVRKGERTRGR